MALFRGAGSATEALATGMDFPGEALTWVLFAQVLSWLIHAQKRLDGEVVYPMLYLLQSCLSPVSKQSFCTVLDGVGFRV